MKDTQYYIALRGSDNKIVLAKDLPSEQNKKDYPWEIRWKRILREYDEAIQQALASAAILKDQTMVNYFIKFPMEKDKPYPVDLSGWNVEIVHGCNFNDPIMHDVSDCHNQLVVLTKREDKPAEHELCPTCQMPRHLPKQYSHNYCHNSFHKPTPTEGDTKKPTE